MSHPIVFRPRGGIVLAGGAIALCALTLVYLAVTDGVLTLVVWGWPVIGFAWLAWLVYIRPRVVVTDGFVEIDNVLRRHRVPWGDVDQVDSRFALTVQTADGRTIRAWAAPAPSARRALSTRREEVDRTPGEGDTRRPSDAEGTDSGDAAIIVRRAVETHRRTGGAARSGGTATSWHLGLAAVTVALLAASVWTIVQAGAHG